MIEKYKNIDQEFLVDGVNVFQEAFDEWTRFKNAMLDFAQQSGTGLEVAAYKTVGYRIESLSDAAAEIGLSKNRLQTRLELRLRQAGFVPVPGGLTYLYLRVTVTRTGGYCIELSFNRTVSFPDAGREYTVFGAAVWDTGSAGTHGGDPEYIVGWVDRTLDRFLNEYLKVNQG